MKIEMYQCDVCGKRWEVGDGNARPHKILFTVKLYSTEPDGLTEEQEFKHVCSDCVKALSKAVRKTVADRRRSNLPGWLADAKPGGPSLTVGEK